MFVRKRLSFRKLISRTVAVLASALLFNGSALGATEPEVSAQPSPLEGSWLLAGSPPSGSTGRYAEKGESAEDGQSFDANGVGLAATFSVHGNRVSASYTSAFPCGGGYGADHDVVSGTLAADGSFVLQPPSTNGVEPSFSLTLRGRVPDPGGSKWEGSYIYKFFSKGACGGTLSDSFQATPILIRPGKFVGRTTLLLGDDVGQGRYTSSSPIEVTLDVESAGDQPDVPGPEDSPVRGWISVRMSVDGYPCYQPVNEEVRFPLSGSFFSGGIPMADGSSLFMYAWIQDVSVHRVKLLLVTTKSGSCVRASGTSVVVSRTE
jgi:hypothetical protein